VRGPSAAAFPARPSCHTRSVIDRRAFLLVTASAPAAPRGFAGTARVALIGADEPRFDEIARGLRQGLDDHRAGTGIVEARVPRGDARVIRETAERVVREGAAVVFAVGSVVARAARAAAPSTPIVFLTPGDPIVAGLVASLARPGGHTTGMTVEYPELTAKRLGLLREILPVLAVHDPDDASPRQGLEAARGAADTVGVRPTAPPTATWRARRPAWSTGSFAATTPASCPWSGRRAWSWW